MTARVERQPHVVRDRESRRKKAAKIIALLSPFTRVEGKRVLDIGCGTGIIGSYFEERGASVVGLDRVDNRDAAASIKVVVNTSSDLPFPDNDFDIVLYNHVIEHVGETEQQLAHLREIRRVLKPHGILYVAVPNKWTLIEPHYKLPLLSWLPLSFSSFLVRATGRGTWYDCVLLSSSELSQLLATAGFDARNRTRHALSAFIENELPMLRSIRPLGALLIRLFPLYEVIIPTIIYIASKEKLASVGDGSQ